MRVEVTCLARRFLSRPPTARDQQSRRSDSGCPAAEAFANHGSCRGPNDPVSVAVCSLLALYQYIATRSVLGGGSGEIDNKSKEFKIRYVVFISRSLLIIDLCYIKKSM